jgi:hypothetical protein
MTAVIVYMIPIILLPWLTTKGNYSWIWKGKHNGGRKKDNIVRTIANLINATNVKVMLNTKQVQNKISHMKKKLSWLMISQIEKLVSD